ALASVWPLAAHKARAAERRAAGALTFTELPHGLDEHFAVAPGYRHQVLLRWGDPLFADAPDFDFLNQSAAAQARQFGFNNDFIGFVSLPFGSGSSDSGLLVVNHEYTDSTLMFPGGPASDQLTREQTDIEIAAHGLSVVEV